MPDPLLFTDLACLEHITGPGHPERPERLLRVHEALTGAGFKLHTPSESQSIPMTEWFLEVHAPEIIEQLQLVAQDGISRFLDPDTPVCQATLNVVERAGRCLLRAVDQVTANEHTLAFCAVRPPGHHAEHDRAMGFCPVNLIATAARYAQKQHGIERVAIIDFDVHHGNGTQQIFYDDPSVLYMSSHQDRFYPGTGTKSEQGEGAGRGCTVNFPVAAGTDDAALLEIYQNQVPKHLDRFRPDLILLSAGFDAHVDDPLAYLCVTDDGFAQLSKLLARYAKAYCNGRLVSVMEGGYNLDVLPGSVVRHVRGLQEGLA